MSRWDIIQDPADSSIQHPIALERNVVFLNGRSGGYPLYSKALVVCAELYDYTNNRLDLLFLPLTTTGGTAAKSAITETVGRFPIGCPIYYNSADTDTTSNTNFTNKEFYTTHEEVDARYTAITGSSVQLGATASSSVFLLVSVDTTTATWVPVNKSGTEIIVTNHQLAQGNYYIYLGKTNGNSIFYFQLEEEHPLYYFDGTNLIEYATYIANALSGLGNYLRINMPSQTISNGSSQFVSVYSGLGSLPNGTYKVTVQRHVMSQSANPSVFHMVVRFRNNNTVNSYYYIAATSEIIPAARQTQDVIDPLGATVIVLVGTVTLTSSRVTPEISVICEGANNAVLGGDVPYGGTYAEIFDDNDFILFERLGTGETHTPQI